MTLLAPIKALFDSSCFTNAITEVVQLSTADFTTAHNLNAGDTGGMEQKDSLDTNPLEGATDGDGLVNPTVAHCNNGAFVRLNPFFAALLDDDADANGVANVDCGKIALELLFFNGANNCLGVHDISKNHRGSS